MLRNYLSDNHLMKRIVLSLIFCVAFMVLGKLIPDLYYRYLDNTNYYTIVQPIPLDRKFYKPCEETQLTITRNSVIDTSLNLDIQLLLRKDDMTIYKVQNASIHRTAIVKSGERQIILTKYPLPCDLPEGNYYWQILLTYKVKGYDREYVAVSDTFNVNKYGIDQNVLKVATQSASLNLKTVTNSNDLQYREKSIDMKKEML